MRGNLDGVGGQTRRAVLKALGGALGIAAAGKASAHGWEGEAGDASATDGTAATEFDRPETQGLSANAEVYGYHSIGDEGPARTGGRARSPHYGALTEIRVRGNYAYVTMFSSRDETSGRGMAIVDISQFLNAETDDGLESAELVVESFFRNPNPGTAMMDIKVDDTGDFVFIGSQPITALFGELSENQEPNTRDSSTAGANAGGLLAVDVSDPRRPELVDYFDAFSTGIHNCFHHRIDGRDYVFANKDINVGDAGLVVFEFDREAGDLRLVNRVTATGGNNAQGEFAATGGLDFYCHDVTVQDDPKTGTPTVYLSYWDGGLMIFDASDPTDFEQVGLFPMFQCHFAVPAPDTVEVNGQQRRVAFASHEESSVSPDGRDGKPNPGSTGTIYLVDADDIYETDGVTECRELANYNWQAGGPSDDDGVDFANFELSPHNSDPAFHGDDLWLTQSHYNGGTRFLRVDPAGERGTTIDGGGRLAEPGEFATTAVVGEPADRDNDATAWTLDEPSDTAFGGDTELTDDGEYTDFIRPVRSVPEDSKMNGLSPGQPNHWAAVQTRGLTVSSDINQGVFVSKHDDIPLQGPIPFVGLERELDTSVYIGSRAGRVEIDVVDADGEVLVRDRVPSEFEVLGEDSQPYESYALGGQTAVEFAVGAGTGDTRQYLVESPGSFGDTGSYTFGPVEFSDDGGRTWHALSGTIESANVLGFDPTGSDSSMTAGTAALATGFTYAQRERLREGMADLFGDEE